MTFYEQLIKLCEKSGTKPTSLIESLGMSKGTMSNWKKGGTPNADAVVRFAEHFNVSTDYLLLGKESPSISKEDSEWLSLIHQLPRDAQLEFKGEIKGYLKCLHKQSVAADEPIRKAK